MEKAVLSDYASYIEEQEERRKDFEKQKVKKNANELLLSFDDSIDHNFFHATNRKAVSTKIAKADTKVKNKKCK